LLAFGFRRCAAAELIEWPDIAAVVKPMPMLADHSEQDRLAGMCQADPDDGHCHVTINQVRRYVGERQSSLRSEPWQLDKTFPRHRLIVGACAGCRGSNVSAGTIVFQELWGWALEFA
jgi:hypothetical protein